MNKLGTLIWISWNILNLVCTSSVPRSDYGELKLFAAPASYEVDTTVLLNDASRRDREVGYKIRATLDLAPAWSNGLSEFLLKFDLVSPQLHSRSTHISADFLPQKSLWDKHAHSTFYAHWKNGFIEAAYLDDSEPAEILNYKKSLISLFQFQVIDGENNETDISGTCRVMYETLSMQNIRKIKTGCESGEAGAADAGDGVESRRLHSYTLSAALDALDELYAEELHTAGDLAAAFALRARAWQRLTRRAGGPAGGTAAGPPGGTLGDALAALPAALAPHSLRLQPLDDSFDDEMDVARAWAAAAAALRDEEAGEGGGAAAARATLRALPAVRAAPRAALLALLQAQREAGGLRALLRLLALAAAPAAHAAAAAFLQLRDPDPLDDLARSYFAALAHAPEPHEEVVLEVLRLGAGAWGAGAGALLAAAAAAPRASPAAERAARDALLKGLAACKKEECLVSRLEALGNLRRADTVEPLLAHAGAAAGSVALAALRALRALPPAALLPAARLARLEALALNARSFDVRGAALDLLLARCAAAPPRLERTAHALLARGHPELRRVFWQRLRALAERGAPVPRLLALLPPRLAAWPARAVAGTSSVLERELGAAGGRRARLDSLQLARGGLLRAGRVALLAARNHSAAADHEDDVVTVELWMRGLEALSGGDADGPALDGEEPAEDAAGGLLLSVGGARLPAITLFSGQAELLGHVWAGRGSEPTNVVRAVRPLPARAGLTPLCAGAALRWRHRAALALALDAQAQASLWSRSARAQLELRAALAADLDARVASASAALAAAAELQAEPRLRIAADLDFYDGVALCVRVATAPHSREQLLRLNATLGAPPRRVRRQRAQAWSVPGRTLALGAPNDVACRTLGSSDD